MTRKDFQELYEQSPERAKKLVIDEMELVFRLANSLFDNMKKIKSKIAQAEKPATLKLSLDGLREIEANITNALKTFNQQFKRI